jgi:hypothetical protein
LVTAFLRAGVLSEDGNAKGNNHRTPQDGILSPLLANIALSVPDEYFTGKWGALGPSWTRAKHRRAGVSATRLVRLCRPTMLQSPWATLAWFFMFVRPKPVAPPYDPHVWSVIFDGVGVAPLPLVLDGATWTRDTAAEFERRNISCLAARFLHCHGIDVPVDVRGWIRRSAFAEAATEGTVVTGAARAFDALTSAGIDFVVVKGVAVSGLYEVGTPRYMGDVDVLVSPTDFQAAFDCLAVRGGRMSSEGVRFTPAVCPSVNVTDDAGLQIDLHRALAPWRWASGLTFDRLAAGSAQANVGGWSVATANNVHSLLATACSIVSDCGTHFEKSLPWRDVVVQIRAVEADGRVDELVSEAVVTDTGWMLKWVLEALPDAVRPRDLCDRLMPPSRFQRAGFALAHDPRSACRQWAWMFMRWPLHQVVAFERGMFWPSRTSLHSQGYTSRAAFMKDLVSEFRSN